MRARRRSNFRQIESIWTVAALRAGAALHADRRYEVSLITVGLKGLVAEPLQLIANEEFPENETVFAISWVQLVLVPEPPTKSAAPLGR